MYFFMLFVCFSIVQADDQLSLVQASKLYDQQQYDEALHMYKEINADHPTVWYNMGNAFFEMHDYSNAYVYWLRAQKYGNACICTLTDYNIRLLPEQLLGDYKGGMIGWLRWLSKYISLYIWQLLLLLLWYVLLFCFYVQYRLRYLVTSLLVLMITISVPIVINWHMSGDEGLIVVDTTMYNGPNSSFYAIGKMTKDKIVAIKGVDRDWINIAFDNQIGWIESRYIELI